MTYKLPETINGYQRPTVVCLCGSTRFWREFQKQGLNETMAGRIVLSIGAASGTDDDHFGNLPREEYDRVKTMLDDLHKRKIDLADEVFILNVGGYIGESTRSELDYALGRGKSVRFLEPDKAPVRDRPKRFILIEDVSAYPADELTCWYYDTHRPLKDDPYQPYMAVQVYSKKGDPNNFICHEKMGLLFTDQAEYYAVCLDCQSNYHHLQWSGSTRNPDWREKSAAYLEKHQDQKGWCEFCDPIFGNGGWSLR